MTNNKQVFGKFLGVLAGKLGLYRLLVYIGIDGFVYRILNKERVAKSIAFFAEKTDQIVKIIDILSDEESKTIYKKAILYRQSRHLYDRPRKCRENEYFIKDLVSITENEVFIDCGAYTGDTINNFITVTKNRFHKIIAFEPDYKNFSVLQSVYGNDSRITLFNAGVWNKDDIVVFQGEADAGSKIAGMDNNAATNVDAKMFSITVKALDNIEDCKDASFIKMDIEGAELNALKGAISTIIRNRPKLAICIYHSDDDMLSIPLYLYSKLENYSFYVRHHSYSIIIFYYELDLPVLSIE